MALHAGKGRGPGHLNRLTTGVAASGGGTTANAQLVFNQPKKTGFLALLLRMP